MKRILFVCTGNTCRSPMAEVLLRYKGNFEVKSAGVFASAGSPASAQSMEVLKEKNMELNHQSTLLSLDLVDWADLILTMTIDHKHYVLQKFPESAIKIYSLKEYVNEGEGDLDISDPFGGSVATYRKTMEEIEQNINLLLKRLS